MIQTIPLLGSVGLVKDIAPHELPLSALSDASNVRMRDGAVERIAGELQVYDAPTVTPYALMLYRTAADLFVVHAGTAKVFVDSAGARTEITGTAPTGGAADRWTGGVLGGVLVMNNGIDAPMFWGGNIANDLATLTGWNANHRCKVLRPFKNYLIALDITKTSTRYPHMVKWSAAADPGTVPASWDETNPALDAGEFDLAETTDNIIDALPLGDVLIVYKAASMYALTYIGGQFIFAQRRLPTDSGMLARGCGCIVPGGHLVLTAGDVVFTDGQTVRSVLTGKLRRWLFGAMDGTFFARSFVVANPASNEAWVCFPEAGSSSCTKAVIWNWADNTLTVRDLDNVTCGVSGPWEYALPDPWEDDAQAWEDDTTLWATSSIPLSQSSLLLGTTGPELVVCDVGTQFDGADYGASIERAGLAFDAPDRVKLVRSIVPRVDGQTGATLYIQAGGAMDAEGSYTWTAPVPYVIGTTRKADLFASGRFLAFRVYSVASFPWRVRSIDLDIVVKGFS